ncbi:MAG: molecular chaperone, partial [Selenomonadaceae bacterium]|nr:molecular chaperone [Selenomonadaceae bacterium]
ISTCNFKIDNRRVAYSIDIETGFENGSTDFGGNNLTYRVMQILKLKLIEAMNRQYNHQSQIIKARREFYGQKDSFDRYAQGIAASIPPLKMLLKEFDIDIFRFIDDNGIDPIYRKLERSYNQAEEILPTKFKLWENRSRTEYFKVRNNYYFLLTMAEAIKKSFFQNAGTLRVQLTVESNHDEPGRNWQIQQTNYEDREDTLRFSIDKWKLTINNSGGLTSINDLPDLVIGRYEIETVLRPDIYNIVQKLLNPLYESGELEEFNLIKLSGQSCKIDLFRTALKEFVPGKLIKSKPKMNDLNKNELKMSCIDGTLKYLRDKKFGYADIQIKNRLPNLPYILTGFTHTGEEVTLINSAQSKSGGCLSRNIEDLTLTLYLKDNEFNLRQEVIYSCELDEFEQKTQEEIEEIYSDKIQQSETDTIVNREVKFFIWTEPLDWSFVVVPVYRNDEQLYIGKEEIFNFEDEQWIKNFFDGLK